MAIRRIFISSISAGGRPYISSFTVDDASVDINAMVTAYNLLCNGLVVSVSEALQLVHPFVSLARFFWCLVRPRAFLVERWRVMSYAPVVVLRGFRYTKLNL